MTLRLSRLVPDEYDRWYYHEPSGLLLHNNSERGWLAVNNVRSVHKELGELQEALGEMDEFTDPSDVLPLPNDYEHAEPPSWEQ